MASVCCPRLRGNGAAISEFLPTTYRPWDPLQDPRSRRPNVIPGLQQPLHRSPYLALLQFILHTTMRIFFKRKNWMNSLTWNFPKSPTEPEKISAFLTTAFTAQHELATLETLRHVSLCLYPHYHAPSTRPFLSEEARLAFVSWPLHLPFILLAMHFLLPVFQFSPQISPPRKDLTWLQT